MALPYVRISLRGNLPGGEVWSINPAFSGTFEPPTFGHAALQAWAQAIVFNVNYNDFPTLRKFLSSSADIASSRVSLYGADGRLADYGEYALASPQQGTATLALPTTAACAISLYTQTPGRRTRGRVFWPALGATLQAETARFSLTDTQALATEAGEMFSQWEEQGPSGAAAHLAVWSTVNQSSTAVSQIRVGDVVDSQRGRKDALVDAYSQVAYPA